MKFSSAFDERALLRRLPIRVRLRLEIFINRHSLETVPLFRYIENVSIKVFILKRMVFHVCDVGNAILREDEDADEIVFMESGSAELRRAILSDAARAAKEKVRNGGSLLDRLKAEAQEEERMAAAQEAAQAHLAAVEEGGDEEEEEVSRGGREVQDPNRDPNQNRALTIRI